MALEETHAENQEDEDVVFDEEDRDVDIEKELLSALSEIKSLKKKNLNLKLLLKEEIEEKIRKSQAQIEEDKKVQEDLKSQIKLKKESCDRLEAEIVS